MRRTDALRVCAGCLVAQRLPAATLCPTCKKEWNDLRRFGPAVEELAARETHPVYIGERCFIPKAAVYVSHAADDEDSGTPTAAWFGTAMRKMLMAFCPNYPVTQAPDYHSVMFGGSDGPGRYLNYLRDTRAKHAVEMTNEQANAMRELYLAINALLTESRREGQVRGQDLIQQLAAGEVTSGAFDQHLEDIAEQNRSARTIAERNIK